MYCRCQLPAAACLRLSSCSWVLPSGACTQGCCRSMACISWGCSCCSLLRFSGGAGPGMCRAACLAGASSRCRLLGVHSSAACAPLVRLAPWCPYPPLMLIKRSRLVTLSVLLPQASPGLQASVALVGTDPLVCLWGSAWGTWCHLACGRRATAADLSCQVGGTARGQCRPLAAIPVSAWGSELAARVVLFERNALVDAMQGAAGGGTAALRAATAVTAGLLPPPPIPNAPRTLSSRY